MHRRGFSLIEMLVAITVGTVIFGIAVGTLHLLLRAEHTGRDRLYQTWTLGRLAEQFRSDIHAAVRPIPGDDARQEEWQFALAGDRIVTYRALPGEVEREQHTAGKLVHRESYVLPSGCSATIAVRSETLPAVASLVITGNGTPPAAAGDMSVAAVLGKDHRFTKSPVGRQ
jgi:prepilin-type N-terminal cleavage/methylation domain-containing protein